MTSLLRIDSSARIEGSHSRMLGDHAERAWVASNPGGAITRRWVGEGTIPLINQDTIGGFFSSPDQLTPELKAATALSDTLIDELQSSDTLLITVPIYNFGPPASLKAWIDQIVRIGRTFSYENGVFGGLARTRRAIVICAYGAQGYLEGEDFHAANFLEPYLKFLLSFIGIADIRFVSIQQTTGAPETVHENVARAVRDVEHAIQSN